MDQRSKTLPLKKDELSTAVDNLAIANKELVFQNEEKEKRAAELVIANKELVFQNEEKENRAAELVIANKELVFQNEEKENRAAELVIANKELIFQNEEKENRAAELVIADEELIFQNEEKENRAAELVIANKELIFQNEEKEKRAAELVIANKELIFQNEEKEKRAAELVIANKELVFQNEEKEKRAAELVIANKELVFQNEEKGKRAAELVIANKELVFQNEEKEQRAAELVIAATAFESQEGILVTDANNVILRVNRAFTTITGYTAEEIIGKNPRQLKSGRHDAAFYAGMWKAINGTGEWAGEIWNRRKNGEVYPDRLTITAVKDANGKVTNYVANLTDISLSKAAAEEIQLLAFYDPLTQLPNRRLLVERIKHALAGSTRSGWIGALLFLDLDHFKTLNDTLGHDFGDCLLQQVADRLTTCVREGDTVARLGGDEFVVMLEGLSEILTEAASQTETVGRKILTTLNESYLLAEQQHHSTASIGAALFYDSQISVDELMKRADLAMYQAKAAGRNDLRFFDPKMQDDVTARATLEADLRRGLQQQ